MCWLSWNLGASIYWNPQGLSRSVQGLLIYFYNKSWKWRMCQCVWLFFHIRVININNTIYIKRSYCFTVSIHCVICKDLTINAVLGTNRCFVGFAGGKRNGSRCVNKCRVVLCYSRWQCCALYWCDRQTDRQTDWVSYLQSPDMQIMALQVLIQILLTSLKMRFYQGIVTELKSCVLIALVLFLLHVWLHYRCCFPLLAANSCILNCILFKLERKNCGT